MIRDRGGARLVSSLALGAAIVAGADAAEAQVRTTHPRLYLTEEDLPALRDDLPAEPDYQQMLGWMDDEVEAAGPPAGLAGDASHFWMQGGAFVALMSPENDAYATEARSWLMALAGYSPNVNLTVDRVRLYAMAIGYDWLYADLSPAERTTVRDKIVAFYDALEDTVASDNYVSGPSRWANVVALAGTTAIHGDDARLDQALEGVLANWRDGYNPALEAIGDGGGHHMGWMYGPAYSGPEAYTMWRTASEDGETWVPDFLRDAPYFHLYAANGDYRVPMVEDCFNNRFFPGAVNQIALASGRFDNAHAEAFYRELEANSPTPLLQPHELWFRLVTKRSAPEPEPLDALPRSRFFPGTGFLVSRDDWQREDATTVVFKASPFYTFGHHQRDEGSFVIDYKGPLLVDAGKYDGSGNDDHYWHFYARTIAHNSLLVRSDDEEPQINMEDFGLDGGQLLKNTQAWNAAQLTEAPMPTGFALQGMVAHSDAEACVWARTDTADAYEAAKLSSYTRDLLEVRRPGGAAHPAIFVLDRATLPVARTGAILWHFASSVTIDGSRISARGVRGLAPGEAEPSSARIRLDLLRPASPSIVPFTGDDAYRVGDTVYAPTGMPLASYWGHVEVSPPEPELATTWSTLIRVGEEELDTDDLSALDIGGDDWAGARLGDTLFAIATPDTVRLELPAGAALTDGCIGGLEPGASVEVAVGDAPTVTVVANDRGLAVFDPDGGEGGSSAATSPDATSGPGGANGSNGTGAGASDGSGAAAPASGPGATAGSGALANGAGGGDPASADDDGCGCAVPGADSRPLTGGAWMAAGLALVAITFRRRVGRRASTL